MRSDLEILLPCSNCGGRLTEENIFEAIRDFGEISKGDMDHLRFYCPGYSDKEGCPGYSREDQQLPAYWIYL